MRPRFLRGTMGRRSRTYRRLDELRKEHEEKRDAIRFRLAEFRGMWNEPDERLFEEVARDWLAGEVDGFSMKEAPHLLRNIGFSDRLAILDRHVLRNLARHGVIRAVPKSLTTKRYREVEVRWRDFARAVGIPLAELDLLFFSRGAGAILK